MDKHYLFNLTQKGLQATYLQVGTLKINEAKMKSGHESRTGSEKVKELKLQM